MKPQTLSGVSAVVLAAGSSTRMGSVKPLVRVGGQAMLQRVLTTLGASRVDETIVVLGYAAQLIRDTIRFDDASIAINDSYRQGMASSIQIGLASVRADAKAALIVLADQPFLKAATIDLLIAEYHSKKPEIIVPLYKGFRGNPVLLDRSVFSELAALRGDIGCRAIFGNHTRGILKVPVEDAGILVDLDTVADVEQFERFDDLQARDSDSFMP
jgi:molybdenum cofactor cytidylyltransferase